MIHADLPQDPDGRGPAGAISFTVAIIFTRDCATSHFSDVHVDRVLAVAEKFNKIDYARTTPITERCVYSLFPHFGHNPCWYVTRHTLIIVKVG